MILSTEESSAVEKALRRLEKEPAWEFNFTFVDQAKEGVVKNYIVRWLNTHYGPLWNNANSSEKVRRPYEYALRNIVLPNPGEEAQSYNLRIKRLVEERTDRLMIKHNGSFSAYEGAYTKLGIPARTIGNNLEEMARIVWAQMTTRERLTHTDEQSYINKIKNIFLSEWQGKELVNLRDYIYFYVTQLRQAYLTGNLDERHLNAEVERIVKAFEDSGYKEKALRALMHVVIVKGATATWNRVPQGEQIHFFKWNSLTASLPYTHAASLDLIDADHHLRTEDAWNMSRLLIITWSRILVL